MKVSVITAKSRATHRQAACHRCGWDQPLTRVDGRNRGRLGSGRSFGWLCDDCIDDLSGASASREMVGARTGTDAKRSQGRRARSVA